MAVVQQEMKIVLRKFSGALFFFLLFINPPPSHTLLRRSLIRPFRFQRSGFLIPRQLTRSANFKKSNLNTVPVSSKSGGKLFDRFRLLGASVFLSRATAVISNNVNSRNVLNDDLTRQLITADVFIRLLS